MTSSPLSVGVVSNIEDIILRAALSSSEFHDAEDRGCEPGTYASFGCKRGIATLPAHASLQLSDCALPDNHAAQLLSPGHSPGARPALSCPNSQSSVGKRDGSSVRLWNNLFRFIRVRQVPWARGPARSSLQPDADSACPPERRGLNLSR
jgi:hypothetical protein